MYGVTLVYILLTYIALLGFRHHFTGAGWRGKMVGLSINTCMTAFHSLDDNDPIVETISRLGEGPISMSTDDVSETTPAMPASVKSLEAFVCNVYVPKAQPGSCPNCAGNFLGQTILRGKCLLQPTVGILIQHVQRVNHYGHAR